MKRILTLIIFLTLPIIARGQGTVVFRNTLSTLISTNASPSGPPTGPMSGAAGSYLFALFSAPPGTTDSNAFTFTGAYGNNSTTAGILFGGIPTISNAAPASTISLLVRGWSLNIGTEYPDVINYLANPTFEGWYGESQIATVQLGGDNPPPQILFGSSPGQIPGFNLDLHGVPEPSSFALAGLGAAALWLFRRRSS